MKILIILFGLLVNAMVSFQAFASCTAGSSYFSINAGTVTVQRDSVVGTVVSNEAYGTEQVAYYCNGIADGGSGIYSTLALNGLSSSGSAVFNTGLNGIGIKTGFLGGFNPGQWSVYIASGSTWNSAGSWTTGGGTTWTYTYQPKVQFVKTAPSAQSGVISNLKIGYFQPRDTSVGLINPQIPIYLSATVNVVACNIVTRTLTFPIGNILASTFGSSVGTTPPGAQSTQNLGLDCNPYANINVSLSGNQNPDVANNSVLALDGQGSAGVATGVGVQLLYNGTPLTLNNRLVLKQSPGGLETFPLTARYYQTRTAVTTGSANASATLNLTYQ